MAKHDGVEYDRRLTATVWRSFLYEVRVVRIVCLSPQAMGIDKLLRQAIRTEQVKVRSGESMRSPIVPLTDQRKHYNGSSSPDVTEMAPTQLQQIRPSNIK